jgi:hypothetical protein
LNLPGNDDTIEAATRRASWDLEAITARLVEAANPPRVHGELGPFEMRPRRPGSDSLGRYPLALPAITAAHVLLDIARRLERDALGHARGQGRTWQEIADALGPAFADAARGADMALPAAAWRYAATGLNPDVKRATPHNPTAMWKCWTCTNYVHEGPPEEGPHAQRGHADGCTRHGDDIAAEAAHEAAHWDER